MRRTGHESLGLLRRQPDAVRKLEVRRAGRKVVLEVREIGKRPKQHASSERQSEKRKKLDRSASSSLLLHL